MKGRKRKRKKEDRVAIEKERMLRLLLPIAPNKSNDIGRGNEGKAWYTSK